MAEEPEDFKEVEDKFKLSILQVDKRLVDLEIAVSELQRIIESPLESDEDVEGLKKRLEDIEDLIMVEQAGILELKKMMEGEKAGVAEDESLLKELANINEKMAVIEDKIHAVKTFTTKDGKEIDPNIVLREFSALKDEVHDNVEKRLAVIEDKIHAVKSFSGDEERTRELEALRDKMESELTVLRGDLENKAVELRNLMKEKIDEHGQRVDEQILEMGNRPVAPGVDVDFINKKIESFKEAVEDVEKEKMDTDARLRVLEKNLEDMERDMKRSASNKVIKELDGTNKDVMNMSSKIESTEKIIRMLTEDVRKMEKNVKKFESFERLRHLSKDVEEKIERFKFIEDELRRLSSRMEMMYSGIDDRIEKFNDLDRKMEKMQEFFPGVAEQLDRNRLDILALKKQGKNSEEFKEKIRQVEGEMTSINASISSLEKAVRAIAASAQKPKGLHMKMKGDMEEKLSDMEARIDQLQSTGAGSGADPNLISKMKQMQSSFESRIRGLEQSNSRAIDQFRNTIKNIQVKTGSVTPVPSPEVEAKIDSKVKDLERRISQYEQSTAQMINEIKIAAKEGKEIKVPDVNVEAKMRELEKRNAKYLQQLKRTFDERSAAMIQELKKAGGEAVVIESKIDELESRNRQLMDEYRRSMESQLRQGMKAPPERVVAVQPQGELFEAQVEELMEKLVFLESRLAAVEDMMTTTYNKKPIVLE